jgi:two-component system, NarL family, response regulator NreC
MPIFVLLADDHQMTRDGLGAFLMQQGFKVNSNASNGQEAVRLAGELQPDVAVLDLAMPIVNGLEAAREIQKISPKTRTIFLTMHNENHYILEALRSGAKGFVTKTHAAEDLVQAIRDAVRGKMYLSPEVSRAVVEAYQAKEALPMDPLTPRERQVLQLVAEGKTTKEAAVTLQISVKTAETHRTRIMEKLNVHETAGLVRYAIRRGIIQP